MRKDGTRFPAQIVVTRRDDASGNPIGYLVISSDISEKRQAEAQLRAASQYARSLIEASLDPLMTINPDGKITDANHAAQLITGQPRDHLIGTDFAVYFTEPDRARAGYRRVFTKGFVIDYPLAFRHVSGTVTEVLYNASLYRDANGAVAGVYAAARDISRMPAADLMPSPRRRGGVLRYVGFAAAAIVFLVAASMVPDGLAQLAATTAGAVQHPAIDSDQFAHEVVAFGGEPGSGTSQCRNGAIAGGNRPGAELHLRICRRGAKTQSWPHRQGGASVAVCQ